MTYRAEGMRCDQRAELEKIGDEKFSFTNYSFNTICESTLKRAEVNIVAEYFANKAARADATPVAVFAGQTLNLGDLPVAVGAIVSGQVTNQSSAPLASEAMTIRPARVSSRKNRMAGVGLRIDQDELAAALLGEPHVVEGVAAVEGVGRVPAPHDDQLGMREGVVLVAVLDGAEGDAAGEGRALVGRHRPGVAGPVRIRRVGSVLRAGLVA